MAKGQSPKRETKKKSQKKDATKTEDTTPTAKKK